MEKIRAGVIGTGAMGRHHVRVLAELDETELLGISDIESERATELAERYDCKVYPNYENLLSLKLDLVVIAVPTTLHVKTGIDALKSGSNILVEKPIADSVEDAVHLMNASRDAGKMLFVGHIERFSSAVEAAKLAVDSGKCGEVLSVSNLRVGQVNQRIFDTGIILDLAIHDIDLISYILGARAKGVYAIAHKKVGNFEDHASIMLEFPHHKSGVIETCWLMPFRSRKMFVTGEKGFLQVDLITRKVEFLQDNFIEEIPCSDEEPLKRQHKSVAASIMNGTPPFIGGEDSTYNLLTAIAAIESYQTGRSVEIELGFEGLLK